MNFQPTKERLLDAAGELGFWVAVCAAGFLWIAAVDWAGVHGAGLGRGGEMAQVLSGLSLTAGVWLGAILFLFSRIIGAHPGEDGRGTLAGLLVTVLPASPLVWYVVDGALSGPRAREMFPPPWGVLLVTFGLCVLLSCAVALLLWLAHLRREGKMDRIGALTGAAALCGLSGVFQWVNGHAYMRLYPEIHTGLTWCAWALAAAGFVFLLLPVGPRRWTVFRWAGPAVAVAAVLSWFVLLSPLRRSHRVRFLVTDRCPSGLQVLQLWPAVRGGHKTAGVEVSTGRAVNGSADHPWGMLRMRGRSVLVITVDALRADRLGCYGGRRPLTPNIDRWARHAVRFDRAYCHAPHSSFSLSAVLTGRPMRSYVALKKPLPPTLASMLRQAGYVTWGFCTRGVFHTGETSLVGYIRDNFGFERFDPHGYDAKELTDLVVRVLEVFETSKSRFFLWVHYFDVHEPYRRHADLDFGKSPSDRYDSEIAYTDRQVRRLLSSAAELDPLPIIILTSDHGEEFGEHGGHYHGSSLYEEQVRVPLIIAVPGVSSRVITQPVSLLSVAPTILDLLDVDPPEPAMEISLVSAMLGSARAIPPVHVEVHTKRMVAAGRYRLIWDTWRRTVELYDLKKDPAERRDLSDSQPNRTAALMALIRDHIRTLGQRGAKVPPALAAARLGGRQAAARLCTLLGNPKAKRVHRVEAARRLGRMDGTCAAAAFKRALTDEDEAIAAEGAIGLGELRRQEGAAALRALLSRAADSALLHRVAVAAGRLGIPESEPYLIAALNGPDPKIRYRASHYLGTVGGPGSVRALIRAFRDGASSHLVAVSLGRVGARSKGRSADRVLGFLLKKLKTERRDHVVKCILRGLGYLARPVALPELKKLLHRRDLPAAREALTRCKGVGRVVWGLDFAPENRNLLEGVAQCRRKKDPLDFGFLEHTVCQLDARATVRFDVPETAGDRTFLIRLKPVVAGKTGKTGMTGKKGPGKRPVLTLTLNGQPLARRTLSRGWQELYLNAGSKMWVQGTNVVGLKVEGAAGLTADYLLAW